MPQKRYNSQNQKPYGKGYGYGGFANHAFTKDEYETLHGLGDHVNDTDRSVVIHGVKSKKHPGATFTATVELGEGKESNGREKLKLTGWERESVQKKTEKKPVERIKSDTERSAEDKPMSARGARAASQFEDIIAADEAKAQAYVHAAEGQHSESELSDMALAYQDRDTGDFGE